MKNTFFFCFALVCAIPLAAQPKTQVSVMRPTTNVAVTHPQTQVAVSKPKTLTLVNPRPTTTVRVKHPGEKPLVAAPESASASAPTPASSAKTAAQSGGSYTPSYKQAKDLKAKNTIPQAAALGVGAAGLNMADPDALAKAAAAAKMNMPKAENAQPNLQDVLNKTNMPKGLESALKQRNFATGKMQE